MTYNNNAINMKKKNYSRPMIVILQMNTESFVAFSAVEQPSDQPQLSKKNRQDLWESWQYDAWEGVDEEEE